MVSEVEVEDAKKVEMQNGLLGGTDRGISCIAMRPCEFWISLPQRQRSFLFAAMVIVLQLFDFTTDVVLLSGIVHTSAAAPCQFCGISSGPYSVNIYIESLGDYTRRYANNEDYYAFDENCIHNSQVNYDACMERYGAVCECSLSPGITYDYIVKEVLAFIKFAEAIVILIVVKEIFKLIIIVLFFCSTKFHTTTWFKYALNSPFLIFALWAPSVRELIVDTIEAEMHRKEQAFHILMDLLVEDMPQMVIPVWYFVRGKPSLVAVVSFAFSCISVLVTMYRAINGIDWSDHASRLVARVKVNAGVTVPAPKILTKLSDHDSASVAVANVRGDDETSELLNSMRSEIQVLYKKFDQMQDRVSDLQSKYDEMHQAWSAKAC
jgi:hypothetical protein